MINAKQNLNETVNDNSKYQRGRLFSLRFESDTMTTKVREPSTLRSSWTIALTIVTSSYVFMENSAKREDAETTATTSR